MFKKKVIIPILAILFLPLWMWLGWLLTPKRKLTIAIVDKTVLNNEREQHRSLAWVLNHERFTKNRSVLYNISDDYYGFFPKSDRKYRIKGLERFSPSQIEQLSNDADAVYLADTYGITKNDWWRSDEPGILYGGLSLRDMDLLTSMNEKHKLVIAEFNSIASPTSTGVRSMFEQTFKIRWSGWQGRYFSSLDTAIHNIPEWLIKNYKSIHQGQWPFKKSGIVLVHEDQRIVVLESNRQLTTDLPVIKAAPGPSDKYGIPSSLPFGNWFEIMELDTNFCNSLADFTLPVNENGKKELAKNNIPDIFPAVIAHKDLSHPFFYFSGNFGEDHQSLISSYFKGVSFFQFFWNKGSNTYDQSGFFWKFYRPMVTKILNDYYKS